MPTNGVLTIRSLVVRAGDPAAPPACPTEGWVSVAVQDSGAGIAPEILPRVFEPFFTTKQHGTGLGLATAQQIAHDLHGELTVESQVGVGTTFTVWLPLVGAIAPRPATTVTQAPAAGVDAVLVVEDEPALRRVVQVILAEAGYHVLVASTPKEAIALATAPGVEIDLLVTDVVMPGMSGPKVAGEIARTHPELPVLYVSGYLGDALSVHGLDEHAPLLRKPFTAEQLLERVRETLDAACKS
jgi:CheY-like chemotaxis protein